MSADSKQKIDYLYEEYVRLSEKSDEIIKGIFDDLKLYGVVSVIIGIWKPVSDLVVSTNLKFASSLVLFLGFFTLLAITGIIASHNLMRQAYAWYFVYNLKAYEVVIKKELGEAEGSWLFNFNLGKEDPQYITATYKISYKFFGFVFASFVIFLPFIVLCYSSFLYAVIYLLLSLLGLVLYLQAFRKVFRQYSSKTYI